MKQAIIMVPLSAFFFLAACGGSPAASTESTVPTSGAEQPVISPAAEPKSGSVPTVPEAPVVAQPVNTVNATPAEQPSPANSSSQFVLSDLKIAPNGVTLGELTTVTVKVTNVGKTTATYIALLKVKPAWAEAPVRILPQESQEVTLDPGESTIITFQTGVMGNGAVIVSIGDQIDRFSVDSQI